MQRIRTVLWCVLLAVLIAAVVHGILFLRAATAVVGSIPGQVQSVQSALTREVQETRRDLVGQIEAARKDAAGQLTSLQSNVFTEVGETRSAIDRRVGDSLARVDAALGTVNSLRADLQPTINNVAAFTGHASEASAILFRRDALPAQLLGLTAAAKVTLGQTATTMRAIQEATPQMLATIQQVGDNVKETTDASTEASRNTAQVMANFARATKPLPTWARIGLAVAPPLAQVGVSVATTLAVTGKVGK